MKEMRKIRILLSVLYLVQISVNNVVCCRDIVSSHAQQQTLRGSSAFRGGGGGGGGGGGVEGLVGKPPLRFRPFYQTLREFTQYILLDLCSMYDALYGA